MHTVARAALCRRHCRRVRAFQLAKGFPSARTRLPSRHGSLSSGAGLYSAQTRAKSAGIHRMREVRQKGWCNGTTWNRTHRAWPGYVREVRAELLLHVAVAPGVPNEAAPQRVRAARNFACCAVAAGARLALQRSAIGGAGPYHLRIRSFVTHEVRTHGTICYVL